MSEGNKSGLVLVVSGLSGSGKSAVLKAFEDNGFLAIDNLPVRLLTKLLAIRKESGDFIRLAVGMDAREAELIDRFAEAFDQTRAMGYELKVLFLEAEDQVLVKRFSETRRTHPLAPEGGLARAIELERRSLAPLREVADLIVDTSQLTAARLKETVLENFVQSSSRRSLAVEVLSFGFKNGLPPEADLMVDVRFLPNPFYVAKLRALDGRDERVRDFVMAHREAREFLEKLLDLLLFLLPQYQKEGKSYLTIAIGCTGGQHRSVTLAINLFERLKSSFSGSLVLRHRDIV
ncbi:MAG: RNase adapter RapZ [Deltaproteobacteria bacterium]|jgi:UPF0042 nucleotide-binding protein|nr:RNase adapter RapZ [Deltaproteobacteria bacterium]MDR1298467.1 RNase adapter RapZ [Deltaproteobacteria bacterium]